MKADPRTIIIRLQSGLEIALFSKLKQFNAIVLIKKNSLQCAAIFAVLQ